MSRCNGDCDPGELLQAFLREEACRTAPEPAQRAVLRLANYAQQAGKLLCEMILDDMQHYVRCLYSLENTDFTADDSLQEIQIVIRLYTWLVHRGCREDNPLQELKKAAVQQIKETLRSAGFTLKEYE